MVIDPERAELEALSAAALFSAARVLEIGCGDGRLARRYAHTTRLTLGIDSAEDRIAAASSFTPSVAQLRFVRGSIPLPLRDATFDLALFGWSL